MSFLRKYCSNFRRKLQLYRQINWVKTIYINFKTLPFNQAKILPIVIFGRCSIQSLTGKIIIPELVKFGMLGFGQRYEIFRKESGSAELNIQGKIILRGKAHFGYDYKIFVAEKALLTLGNMSSMASGAKIICTQNIELGDFCRMGSECQLIDTNFHNLKDTKTKKILPKITTIRLGSYNFISNRVTIMGKTVTPNYCIIASNSLCNKDYSDLGNNILIGGIPTKFIKDKITRDWEAEKKELEDYLTIKL